ncbi:hypothetical protein IW492_14970 [Enterococcus sp. BWB1-3]|uniref:hypothetical protein n=1 Tax=Enterococcus sp. BWB1-3 TaxID=2787713 RepID=UPI001920B62B|nr:hypothetical protein [Enterococcus sp. BWB1-3]MBL1230531.1 hypothetical protein [Enterococcus sp. BWB1-3]
MEKDQEIALMEHQMLYEANKGHWQKDLKVDRIIDAIKQGVLEIEGKYHLFIKYLAGTFGVIVPEEFVLLDQRMLDYKYPYTQRAQYIFSDEDTTHVISLDPLGTAIEEEQFKGFVTGVVSSMRKLRPELSFLHEASVFKEEQSYSYFDSLISTLDEKIYFFFGITMLDQELAFFSCTVPEMEKDFWFPLCVGMLDTITLENKEDQ